jgi:hypothetical protein
MVTLARDRPNEDRQPRTLNQSALTQIATCYFVRVAVKALSAPQQVTGADRTFQTTE